MIAAFLAAFSLPVAARQSPCGTHEEIIRTLAERWGERSAGMGIVANGFVIEFVTNPETGSFTVIMTRPGGATCVVLAGENWEGWRPRGADEDGPFSIPGVTPPQATP